MNVIVANKYQDVLTTVDIDVIKTMYGEFEVDEIINSFTNFFYNKMILDITSIKNYQDVANIQKLSMNLDMAKVVLLLDDTVESSSAAYLSKLISMGIYNFTKNVENVKYLIDNPNTYKDVAHYHQINPVVEQGMAPQGPMMSNVMSSSPMGGPIVIGVKGVTDHAGATSLTYMMKKQLAYNYKVLAVEINKNDFTYFNDKELVSVSQVEFPTIVMKNQNYEVILVDMNDASVADVCSDMIYLIEPSTIKLSKMIRRNKSVFDRLKGKKIILNKSLLDHKDVMDFEFEARSEVFFSVPPLDDKIAKHKVLDEFLSKLGFIRQRGADTTSGKKGLFRK